jgi:hypothetical protein
MALNTKFPTHPTEVERASLFGKLPAVVQLAPFKPMIDGGAQLE